ncbi:MAG: glycosyltransferase [Dysgonamonadaceae bacterium]|jgi:glycosyltransferase involved in cell wall biosynthesis|nr:glycosyltransferase [Dysgonamonadaceae bacterium]
MNTPLISIITVTYNAIDDLEQTMQSVFAQTYPNIEYIVIDGGSVDGTINIIRKYNDRLSFWVSEKDKGIYDAMNKGIRQSKGELIGMINAGDYYEPDAVQVMVEAYNQHPDYAIFHGNINLLNEDGTFFKVKKPNPDLSQFYKGMSVYHPTLFVQKTVYGTKQNFRENLYNIHFKIAADFDFILRNYLAGTRFYYVDKVIANFKQGGYSVKNKKTTNIECRNILYENGYEKEIVEPLFKKWNAIYRKQGLLDVGYAFVRKLFSDKIANKIASYIVNR